jgi:hypothetical protein
VSRQNVTFGRDLVSPRLASWHALFKRLALVNLSQGADEFQWSLHESGRFFVNSMYRAIFQQELSINNNKKNQDPI